MTDDASYDSVTNSPHRLEITVKLRPADTTSMHVRASTRPRQHDSSAQHSLRHGVDDLIDVSNGQAAQRTEGFLAANLQLVQVRVNAVLAEDVTTWRDSWRLDHLQADAAAAVGAATRRAGASWHCR